MASILCVTAGLPSVLFKSVELARRLAAAGHDVACAAPAAARELVERQRLEFVPLAPSRFEEFLIADAELGPARRIRQLERRRARALESLAAAEFTRLLEEREPDLVLINGEMHEQILPAIGAGRRVALVNTFASIWRRPGLPPPSRLVRPGVGLAGSRLGIFCLWLELRLRKRLRAWGQWLRRLGCDRLSILRRLAAERGVDFRRETDRSQWLIPFTYRRLPVLSLQALEFEFPHRPPRRVRYVGPMVLRDRAAGPLPAADRQRLTAIFDHRRSAVDGGALIYAAFGSLLTADPALLARLLGVVGERPGWQLVLSLSGRPAPAGPVPPRVHAFDWLPQVEVLEHADAAVTHGGANTINECVLAGVPMLVYCGFETDMAGNTARVAHHGIGVAGDPRDSTAEMRRRLDGLLGEPGYRDNARRLRRQFLRYAEARAAERAVEELLAAAPASGAS